MGWACLAVGVVALVLSTTSLLPLRGAVGSGFTFVPSWIVGEAPLHFFGAAVAAMLGCGLEGGFGSWQGWLGLSLALVACAGFAVQFASGLRSRGWFESALAQAGQPGEPWRWSAQDSLRVVLALPVLPRGVGAAPEPRLCERRFTRPSSRHLLQGGGRGRPGAPVLPRRRLGDGGQARAGHPDARASRRAGLCLRERQLRPEPEGEMAPSRPRLQAGAGLGEETHRRVRGRSRPCLRGRRFGRRPSCALVALTAGEAAWQPGIEDEDTTVAACIPLYGVYDFVDHEKIGNANLGPILERRVFAEGAAEAYEAASPIARVSESHPLFWWSTVATMSSSRSRAPAPSWPPCGRGAVSPCPTSSFPSPSMVSTTSGRRGRSISCTPSSASPRRLSRPGPRNGRSEGRSPGCLGLPCNRVATATRADRLERMTNLVLVLLEASRPLSLREIVSTVVGYPEGKEASRQAFERDKRALRVLGIPISVETLAGEEQLGYRIHPQDYYLPDLRLSPEEEQALSFAVAAVQLGGAAGRDAVAKLGATGEVPEPGLPPIAVLPSLPALGPLHQAVRDRAIVSFGYRGRRREVEPYGLTFKFTAWYLVGRDRTAPGHGAAHVPRRPVRRRARPRGVRGLRAAGGLRPDRSRALPPLAARQQARRPDPSTQKTRRPSG